VHLLLEELKISLKSSSSTQTLCHTTSPRVGVRVPQKGLHLLLCLFYIRETINFRWC